MLALVDHSLIGNLYQFRADFDGELDEIETDIVIDGRDVVLPWEAQRVADEWASQFTGMPDVAHNLAYFQTVASGFTRNEVIAAAEEARDRARKPKGVPNPYSGSTKVIAAL